MLNPLARQSVPCPFVHGKWLAAVGSKGSHPKAVELESPPFLGVPWGTLKV
jgi:hypothetical protein